MIFKICIPVDSVGPEVPVRSGDSVAVRLFVTVLFVSLKITYFVAEIVRHWFEDLHSWKPKKLIDIILIANRGDGRRIYESLKFQRRTDNGSRRSYSWQSLKINKKM